MKLEIDIPEKMYSFVCKLKDGETSYPITEQLYKSVRNGKFIPSKQEQKVGDTCDTIHR